MHATNISDNNAMDHLNDGRKAGPPPAPELR